MADQFINNLSVTWDSASTEFDFMRVNVTDTNSDAASRFLWFGVNDVPMFTVGKNGAGHFDAGVTLGAPLGVASGGTGAATAAAARTNLGLDDAVNAYRQGNILGTVSHSGGVPTGAVIQRGSNSNGEFLRFADGTQWCWNTFPTFDDPTALGSGTFSSPYRTNPFTWDFPASFSASPNLQFHVGRNSGTETHRFFATGSGTTTTTQARDLQAVRIGGSDSTGSPTSYAFAVGFWF